MAVYYVMSPMPDTRTGVSNAENIYAGLGNPAVWDRMQGRWVPDWRDMEHVIILGSEATIEIDWGTPEVPDVETRAWMTPKLTERTKILVDPYRQNFGLLYDWVRVSDAAPDIDIARYYPDGYTLQQLRDADVLDANELPLLDMYRTFERRYSKKTIYPAAIHQDWNLLYKDASVLLGDIPKFFPAGLGAPATITMNNGEMRFTRVDLGEGFNYSRGVVLFDSDEDGPCAAVFSGSFNAWIHDPGMLDYNQYLDSSVPLKVEFDVQNHLWNIVATPCYISY
jgi:hypothetical protein